MKTVREFAPEWASFGVCLGTVIARHRETLGLSQLECGRHLLASQAWWSRLEVDASKCSVGDFLQVSVNVLRSTPVALFEEAGRLVLQRRRAIEAQRGDVS